MKTTISVCTLCLLLCVAGSNAQPVVRTVGGHNAANNKAVRDVTAALNSAIERLNREDSSDSTHLSVSFLTGDIQHAFANFIDDHFAAGYGLTPPGDCTTELIDVERVSKPFSQAVHQALTEHQNYYISASSECLSNAVLDISLDLLPLINEGRCIYEDQFITVNYLLNYGFDNDLYDTAENVILGMLENNEDKAKHCHDLDDYYEYYD